MIFSFVITGLYLILILSFIFGLYKTKIFSAAASKQSLAFSIIIPYRDESKNLPSLLQSLKELAYPKEHFECLLVNDDSTDNSTAIIHHFLKDSEVNYQIIDIQRTSNSPKKDAINTAILSACFDWVLTTDADCILPKNWLNTFGSFIENHTSKMIVGPVCYQIKSNSFLEIFQRFDFLSLQGSTIGGFGIGAPFLCNGANLAYKKEVFFEVNGFDGNDKVASGDDIFLFEKFYKNYPKEIHFLKARSVIVTTKPLSTWTQLIHQRTRWAAKSSSYQLLFGKMVGIIVLLMNFIFILSLCGLILWRENSLLFIFTILLKIGIDYALLLKTFRFYQYPITILGFLCSSLVYPFFCVIIFSKAIFGSYHWKGRIFKK